jgi:flagellar L-ring protein precursor FlgH
MHMLKRIILVGFLSLLPVVLAAQTPAADTTSPRPRRSWTSDRREYVVGDILTVLVDEQTLATANKGQTGSDQTSRDLGLNVPVPGTAGLGSTDVKLSTSKNASSRQSGQASRDMHFRGEMTVRVVKIEPSGVLEVKGARTVDVDKNKQQLTLTGFVRPQDVSLINTVESARIADAQLLYSLTGDLGATRGGILSRLASVFWP